MTSLDTLAITVPTMIGLLGLLIAFLNYRRGVKKDDKENDESVSNRAKEEEEHRKEVELKLIAIEKDVQYIRIAVDKIEQRGDDHEKRISKLEAECRKHKGGK